MEYVRLVDTDINADLLKQEVFGLLSKYDLSNQQQVSLTSISGDNDWWSSAGKIHDLKNPERFYSTINKGLNGTYIEELINRYPKYYRWRLLRLLPRETYTVHADSNNQMSNFRLHIPVVTNEQSFLSFCSSVPKHKTNIMFYFEHLEAGNSYMVDTTNYHTAVNYGPATRYHMVGVRYENSNHGSH
jgi:hypothetical protein